MRGRCAGSDTKRSSKRIVNLPGRAAPMKVGAKQRLQLVRCRQLYRGRPGLRLAFAVQPDIERRQIG